MDSQSPKRTASDADLYDSEDERGGRFQRSQDASPRRLNFSPMVHSSQNSGGGFRGRAEEGMEDGGEGGVNDRDILDEETCYFSKISCSDVAAGSFVLPKNIKMLTPFPDCFECLTIPFHMETDDIPEHAKHFLRTLTEVNHCLQNDALEADSYFVKFLPGNEIVFSKSGTAATQFKYQDKTYSLLTCHANIVTVYAKECHQQEDEDGEQAPVSNRQIKFFVVYVIYPCVFNFGKCLNDIGNEKVQLRAKKDYRNPFSEKERNCYSKDYIMYTNVIKNMGRTFGGNARWNVRDSDTRLKGSIDSLFANAESIRLISPPVALRTILNFSAFELETDVNSLAVLNWPGGDVDSWGDAAENCVSAYVSRAIWREEAILDQTVFMSLSKKEQDKSGPSVPNAIPEIDLAAQLFQRDSAREYDTNFLISRTETTISFDLSCLYIVLKNVGLNGIEIPQNVQRVLLKKGSYFEHLDSSSIELLNSMDAFIGRVEAEKIMHAVDKASATPTLHGNMQKRYDNLMKITMCQVRPISLFLSLIAFFDSFRCLQVLSKRFSAWISLSKDNVEQTFSRVKSKRDYISEEGIACMSILSSENGFLKSMEENRSFAFNNLLKSPVLYDALLNEDEYASMGISGFMKYQIMSNFAIERYAGVYNLTGMQLQIFMLLLNNILYGLIYFSQETTPSTPYGTGGPLIPTDGGGSYRKGESKYPVMDKKKSSGANNSIEKAFMAMSPRTYGFDVDFPKACDVEGMTMLALHMITSVKKIGSKLAPNQPLLELRKVIAITELVVKNGNQPGPHEKFIDMMSQQIPRGSDTGLQKERTLTDVENSKRQCVKFEKVNSPCVSFLCCNEIPETHNERMDAIATVSRTVFTTDFRDDVGISEPSEQDKIFFRCFFLDTPVVSKLGAHCQRESSIGNIGKCLPTPRTILDMFFAAYKATAFLQSGIQRMATTWPRMKEGAECRGTCKTFSGYVEVPSVVGGGRSGVDVSLVTHVLTNFKFNPIALEVVPSITGDLFDHRLNTPLLVVMNIVSSILQTPVLEPESLRSWMATSVFPDTFNGKRDEEKVRVWLNSFGQADRFFESGQLWVTKNGGGDGSAGANSFASMFQNPNAANGGDGFQASVFQKQERSELMPVGFGDTIANNLFDFQGVTGVLAAMNFPGWEEKKTNPLKNYITEIISTTFQTRGSLFSSLLEMENTGKLFSALVNRSVLGSNGRVSSDNIALAKIFPPTMGRGGWTMAFDARMLLLLSSLSFEREDVTAFHLIKPPMRTHFIKNVIELFFTRVPGNCFPFPTATLDIPGDGTNIVRMKKMKAQTIQGKTRTLFVRSGIQKASADEKHGKYATYTRLAEIVNKIPYFQVLPMKEGASALSPSLHAEDSSEAEVFLAAAKYLNLPLLRYIPVTAFNRIVRVGTWTPALNLRTGRLNAYNFAAGKSGQLQVSDGTSGQTFENASSYTLAEMGLMPTPHFARVGVLLFTAKDESQWAEPEAAQFSDTVTMDPSNLRYTLDGCELAGDDWDCNFAVIVPQAADDCEKEEQWFSETLEYTALVCDENGTTRRAPIGLSEVRKSLVPYGSDLLVEFSFVYCINEEHSEFVGSPWYVWPGVNPGHGQSAHVWASLSYIDEDDPRMWLDGVFQHDHLCVLVTEFSSELERYEDVAEDGRRVYVFFLPVFYLFNFF
jgi:hypothetical protein